MDQRILLVTLLIGTVVADLVSDTKILQGRAMFYSEIGCTPLSGSAYVCPDFKTTINKDKCYFDGKKYDIGTEIRDSGPYKYCQSSCHCLPPHLEGEVARLVCKQVSCPELFGHAPMVPGPDCRRQYKEDRCCSSGDICGAELEALPKCNLEGKIYYEGERMYPEGQCYVCRCTNDFDNSTIAENPYCEQISCQVRQFHGNNLHNGCAPVFYKSVCCPVDFRCPVAGDKVIAEGQREDGVCIFGDLQVGVGGEINPVDTDTVCRCIAPPMLECLKVSVYPQF